MEAISKQLNKDYYVFQQDPTIECLNIEKFNYLIDNFCDFVLKPAKIGETIKCKVMSLNKVFKEYMLVVETSEGYNIPILVARKSNVLSTAYVVNTYVDCQMDYEITLATLEKGMFSTSSILFEFLNKNENQIIDAEQTQKVSNVRNQLLRIDFETFFSNLGQPLKFTTYLPGIDESQQSYKITSFDDINDLIRKNIVSNEDVNKVNTDTTVVIENDIIIEPIQYKNKAAITSIFNTDLVKLITKPAIYDKTRKSFLLQMGERVRLASEFNFQLVNELNINYVVLQCGQHDKDTFVCDYSYPLNALQAFSILIARLHKTNSFY